MLKESNALDDIEPELQEQLTTEQWKPDKQKSAKAVLYYNLAVALTLRGDLDKAGELLKQVSQNLILSSVQNVCNLKEFYYFLNIINLQKSFNIFVYFNNCLQK